jgi:hypothetical protein
MSFFTRLKQFFTRKPRQSFKYTGDEFRQLLGTPPISQSDGTLAKVWLKQVLQLREANAQWVEIFKALNPETNSEVAQLLIELRGPHMFIPHVALNLMEVGCQQAIARDPAATVVTALRTALKLADPFSRAPG